MKIRKSTLRRIIREEIEQDQEVDVKEPIAIPSDIAARGPMGTMVQNIADQIDTNLHTSLVDFFQQKVGPFAAKNLKVGDVLPGALRKTGLAGAVEDTLEDIVLQAVDDSAEQLSQQVMSNVVDSMPSPISEAIKRRMNRKRRLNEEHHGSPCPYATAQALKASGMREPDIIGWVADLLNELRPGDVSDLTADDLIGVAAAAPQVIEL